MDLVSKYTFTQDSTAQIDAERSRLASVVKDIRTVQIPALKARELTMLDKINEVRQTEETRNRKTKSKSKENAKRNCHCKRRGLCSSTWYGCRC